MPSPAQQLIDNLVETIFTIPAEEWTRQGKGVRDTEKEKPRSFNERSVKSLALHLKNVTMIRLNTKGEPFDKDRSRPKDIDTPHPIGPITTNQAIIIDVLARLITAVVRASSADLADEKKTKYVPEMVNDSDYANVYADKIIEELQRSDAITSHEGLGNLAKLLKKSADYARRNNGKQLPSLFKELCCILVNEMMYCGIASRVISKQKQAELSKRKVDYLDTTTAIEVDSNGVKLSVSAVQNKTWVGGGGDKDGDPTTHYGQDLQPYLQAIEAKGSRHPEDIRLARIFNFLREELKSVPPREARRAYVAKKGVRGLGEIFHGHMDGLRVVEGLPDLLNDTLLTRIGAYIRTLSYSKEGAETETETNIPLDTVLDILFGSGFVISDFPADQDAAKKLLYQLLILTKVSQNILVEQGMLQGNKRGQVFLPLCEEQESIENLQSAIQGIYDDIIRAVEAIQADPSLDKLAKEQKTTALLSHFVAIDENGNKTFVFGAFPGPSDLTKRMGSASHFRMVEAMANSLLSFRDFQAKLQKNLTPEVARECQIENWNFLIEYGKGTALRRGAGSVFDSEIGRTRQGIGIPSSSKQLNKTYHQVAQEGDRSTENLRALKRYAEEHADFIVKASEAHRRFFESDPKRKEKGVVVEWYDNCLLKHPLMAVTLKDVLNNQGCRGATVDGEYKHVDTENTRAIEDAANKTMIGVVSEAPWPAKDMAIPNFKQFIQQPLGFMMFMQGLTQMVTTDPHRARMYDCPEVLIEETSHYLYEIAKYLSVQLSVELPTFKVFQDDLQARLDLTVELTEALKQRIELHPTLQKRLELFQAQLHLMAQTNELLTQEVAVIKAQVDQHDPANEKTPKWEFAKKKVDLANAAVILNQLVNFAGAPLQEMANVKAYSEPSHELKREATTGGQQEQAASAAASSEPKTMVESVKNATQFWPVSDKLYEVSVARLNTLMGAR